MFNRTHRNFAVLFATSALLFLSACSSSSSTSENPVTASITNGYRMTSLETRDGTDIITGSSTITLDGAARTTEWASFDDAGLLISRNVATYDDKGRLIQAEQYSDSGALDHTSTYTIVDGLITQRVRDDNTAVRFMYTDDGVLSAREYSDENTGLITRLVEFASNSAGQVISSTDTQYENGTPGDSFRRTFSYDTQGRLTKRTDQDGWEDEYRYDANGNNTLYIYRDDLGDVISQTTYTYEQSPIPVANFRLRVNRFWL